VKYGIIKYFFRYSWVESASLEKFQVPLGDIICPDKFSLVWDANNVQVLAIKKKGQTAAWELPGGWLRWKTCNEEHLKNAGMRYNAFFLAKWFLLIISLDAHIQVESFSLHPEAMSEKVTNVWKFEGEFNLISHAIDCVSMT
jgi:hypothetical protein